MWRRLAAAVPIGYAGCPPTLCGAGRRGVCPGLAPHLRLIESKAEVAARRVPAVLPARPREAFGRLRIVREVFVAVEGASIAAADFELAPAAWRRRRYPRHRAVVRSNSCLRLATRLRTPCCPWRGHRLRAGRDVGPSLAALVGRAPLGAGPRARARACARRSGVSAARAALGDRAATASALPRPLVVGGRVALPCLGGRLALSVASLGDVQVVGQGAAGQLRLSSGVGIPGLA